MRGVWVISEAAAAPEPAPKQPGTTDEVESSVNRTERAGDHIMRSRGSSVLKSGKRPRTC